MAGWERWAPRGFKLLPAAAGPHLFLLDDDLKQAWFKETLVPALTAEALSGPAPTPAAAAVPPLPPVSSGKGDTASPAVDEATCRKDMACPDAPAAVVEDKVSLPVAPAWPLRVLCLHGFGGSSEILSKQTERLRTLVDQDLKVCLLPMTPL